MNYYSTASLTYGHHLHLLFGAFLLLAAFMLITWVIRFAKKDELKNWIIGLGLIGLIGWFLTASMSGFGRSYYNKDMHGWNGGSLNMMTPGTLECMQDEDCHDEMEDVMHHMMGIDE